MSFCRRLAGWLLVTLGVGLSTIPVSIYHAVHGNVQTMIALAEWAQSVLTLQPDPLLLQAVPLILKIHLFFGLRVFARPGDIHGTRAWIAEYRRLFGRCIEAKKVSPAEVRDALERIFGLLRHID